MRTAEIFRERTEALRADMAAGGDLSKWRRAFAAEGFGSLLADLHADPQMAAPAMLAWLDFVAEYTKACAARG